MTEETILKKLKTYRAIILILGTLLLGAVGYSYTLRLDIDRIDEKQDRQYDVIVNSYFRNVHIMIDELGRH